MNRICMIASGMMGKIVEIQEYNTLQIMPLAIMQILFFF
jgi:hypothetical protein